jgi:hypothetical protein
MKNDRRKSYGHTPCRVYPRPGGTAEKTADFQTVSLQLEREAAIKFATDILKACQHADQIDLCGFRDRDYVTVTTPPGSEPATTKAA